jgi:hypothetical protein
MEDTVLYQVNPSTGAIVNTLQFQTSAINSLISYNISPDDTKIVVVGSNSNNDAYWAIVSTSTMLPTSQMKNSGVIATNVIWVSNTDFIIVISSKGNSPFVETYERYTTSGTLVWTLNLDCSDCLGVTGGSASSEIILVDNGNFVSFWCPNSASGSCAFVKANQATGAIVSLEYLHHSASLYQNYVFQDQIKMFFTNQGIIPYLYLNFVTADDLNQYFLQIDIDTNVITNGLTYDN